MATCKRANAGENVEKVDAIIDFAGLESPTRPDSVPQWGPAPKLYPTELNLVNL